MSGTRHIPGHVLISTRRVELWRNSACEVGGQNLFIVQFKAEFFVSRDSVEMDAIQAFAKKKADSDAGILEGLESEQTALLPICCTLVRSAPLQLYLPKWALFSLTVH